MISWSYTIKEFKKITILINILLFIFVLNTLSGTVSDPDLWGYLAFGKLFWQSRNFPYQDVYSYVPTLNLWVYHEWLTGVVFFPLYEKTGAMGLQLLKYLVGLLTVYLIYLTARHRGAHPLAAATVLLITIGFINVGYSAVRAQIFTYFFLFLLFTFWSVTENRSNGLCLGLYQYPCLFGATCTEDLFPVLVLSRYMRQGRRLLVVLPGPIWLFLFFPE